MWGRFPASASSSVQKVLTNSSRFVAALPLRSTVVSAGGALSVSPARGNHLRGLTTGTSRSTPSSAASPRPEQNACASQHERQDFASEGAETTEPRGGRPTTTPSSDDHSERSSSSSGAFPPQRRPRGWWFVDGTLVARRYQFASRKDTGASSSDDKNAAKKKKYTPSQQSCLANVCLKLWSLKLLAQECDANLFVVFDAKDNVSWRKQFLGEYKKRDTYKTPEERASYENMMQMVRRKFLRYAGIPYLDTPFGLEADDALAVLACSTRSRLRMQELGEKYHVELRARRDSLRAKTSVVGEDRVDCESSSGAEGGTNSEKSSPVEGKKSRGRGKKKTPGTDTTTASAATTKKQKRKKSEDLDLLQDTADESCDEHDPVFRNNTAPRTVVLTTDKDLWQLHEHGVDVLDPFDLTWLTEHACLEKHGVVPGRMAEHLAINGDTADDVPKGARGFGPKLISALFDEVPPWVTLSELVSVPEVPRKRLPWEKESAGVDEKQSVVEESKLRKKRRSKIRKQGVDYLKQALPEKEVKLLQNSASDVLRNYELVRLPANPPVGDLASQQTGLSFYNLKKALRTSEDRQQLGRMFAFLREHGSTAGAVPGDISEVYQRADGSYRKFLLDVHRRTAGVWGWKKPRLKKGAGGGAVVGGGVSLPLPATPGSRFGGAEHKGHQKYSTFCGREQDHYRHEYNYKHFMNNDGRRAVWRRSRSKKATSNCFVPCDADQERRLRLLFDTYKPGESFKRYSEGGPESVVYILEDGSHYLRKQSTVLPRLTRYEQHRDLPSIEEELDEVFGAVAPPARRRAGHSVSNTSSSMQDEPVPLQPQ